MPANAQITARRPAVMHGSEFLSLSIGACRTTRSVAFQPWTTGNTQPYIRSLREGALAHADVNRLGRPSAAELPEQRLFTSAPADTTASQKSKFS